MNERKTIVCQVCPDDRVFYLWKCSGKCGRKGVARTPIPENDQSCYVAGCGGKITCKKMYPLGTLEVIDERKEGDCV
jgi:hypothetical protein